MTTPIIHPNWARPALNMVDGYSLEMTAKDVEALRGLPPRLRPKRRSR
ncbi:hypothetical protein [Novosphingobium sp. ST904]|nr:hypothetical protein [Novosphingobium sp. ST904]